MKVHAIKAYFATQALTRPRKPVVHIQKPKVNTQKIEVGKISVGTRGRIINIKA